MAVRNPGAELPVVVLNDLITAQMKRKINVDVPTHYMQIRMFVPFQSRVFQFASETVGWHGFFIFYTSVLIPCVGGNHSVSFKRGLSLYLLSDWKNFFNNTL
jgi:hypothetical protein